jgi:hypothetical protein
MHRTRDMIRQYGAQLRVRSEFAHHSEWIVIPLEAAIACCISRIVVDE